MKVNNASKIVKWIFFLWIIVLVGTLLMCLFLYRNTMEYINYTVEESIDKSSIKISNTINERLRFLENTASTITDDMIEHPQLSVENLNSIREEQGFRELSVASLDGTAYTQNGTKVNLYTRDYFQKALAGDSNLSQALSSRNNGDPVNVYVVPIYRENQIVGILWGSVEADSLYENLELSDIARYGDVYVVDSQTNVIVEERNTIGESNFFDYVQQHAQKNKEQQNQNSISHMKKEMATNESGYQRFSYDNQSFYIYYNQLNYNEWWIMVKIPSFAINVYAGNQIKIVLITSVILLTIISLGFYIILSRLLQLNKDIEQQSFTDLVTDGKNDYYLKFNIRKLLKKQGNQVLISVKVNNTDYLVKVLGLNQVNKKLKDFYAAVESSLNEHEVIVHSFFGDFKLLKEYKGLSSIIDYMEKLNTIDSEFKLVIGIYQIEKEMIDYNQMCLNTLIARSNLNENCNYGFYSKSIHEEELQRNQLEKDIIQGIQNQEFKAWFQPKYSHDGKTLVGAEALVRWYKDDQIIAPYVFVPICEANNKIKEIDMLVLEDVCKQIKKWLNQGKKIVPISVNLSRNYFDQHDFIEKIALMVEFYQIPTNYIEFEITETSIEGHKENLKRIIDELHQKGFKIALDDFGVGYSSINTLVSMEFDTIKIDKVFVDGIGEEKWNNIIKYVISLAKQLNAKTVAEGVETKEQLDFLANHDCDIIQGYYLGKPMDIHNFEELL